MGMRVRVCAASEVAPGDAKPFAVPGVTIPVLVTNTGERYLATSSMCPHEDVSLIGAKRKGTRIFCPGHGYEFDLAAGTCKHDPKLVLRCYVVTRVGDDLFVDLL